MRVLETSNTFLDVDWNHNEERWFGVHRMDGHLFAINLYFFSVWIHI